MNATASTATMDTLTSTLRDLLPAGGTVEGQFHPMEDGKMFFDIQSVDVKGDDNADAMPEDVLGEVGYQRVTDLFHEVFDAGHLPGYTEDQKYYAFDF